MSDQNLPIRPHQSDNPPVDGTQLLRVPSGYEVVVESEKLEESDTHLVDHLKILWSRRWLLVLVSLSGLLLTVLFVLHYNRTTAPFYRALAQIQVDTDLKDLLSMPDRGNQHALQMESTTQVEILRSKTLIQKVLTSPLLTGVSPTSATVSTSEEQRVATAGVQPAPQRPSAKAPANEVPASTSVFRQAWDQLMPPPKLHLTEENQADFRISGFQRLLEVIPVEGTRIIQVSYRSPDPDFSARFVNALCQAYIDYDYETRIQSVERARQWLKGEIDEVKGQIQKSEAEFNAFATRVGINHALTPAMSVGQFESSVATTRQQLSDAEQTLFQREQEIKLIESDLFSAQKNNDEGRLDELRAQTMTLQKDNAILPALERQLAEAKISLSMLESTFTPASVQVKEARAEVELLEAKLLDERGRIEKEYAQRQDLLQKQIEIEHDRLAKNASLDKRRALAMAQFEHERALAQVRHLREKHAADMATLGKIQQNLSEFSMLQREVEVNRDVYNTLLSKWKEIDAFAEIGGSKIAIVQKATSPIFPIDMGKSLRFLLMGIFLSFALGVGSVYFQEYMDRTVKLPRGRRKLHGLRILSMVPKLKRPLMMRGLQSRPESALIDSPHTAVAEGFRVLRTNLKLGRGVQVPRKLMIASSIEGEGKTTVAANLAVAFAQQGRKVLLIDADLKKAGINEVFHVKRSPGLSDLLNGLFADYSNGISDIDPVVATTVPNLYVLPAGHPTMHPIDLLDTPNMEWLLRFFENHYDHIIIDTPPVLYLADFSILTPYVDGVVLVAQPGKTPDDAVPFVRDKILEAGGNLLGIVVNNPLERLTLRQAPGYHYGYGYMHYKYPKEIQTLGAK